VWGVIKELKINRAVFFNSPEKSTYQKFSDNHYM
jgi:hypothetical protein